MSSFKMTRGHRPLSAGPACWFLAASAVWCLGAGIQAEPPLAAQQKEQIKEAQERLQQAFKLFQEGMYAQALEPCRQALDGFKKTIGEAHPDYASVLNFLGYLHYELGEYDKAE